MFRAFKIKLYFCVSKYEDFRPSNGTRYFHSSLTGHQIFTFNEKSVYFTLRVKVDVIADGFYAPFMLPSQVCQPTFMGCVRRHFSAPFLFFCLCLLSNVCLSPLIIYSISASYVLFSASMLIFIFVVWALLSLSYIFTFLLVHYTELRLRLVYQFTSYCEHLSLVQTLSLTN